MTPAERRAVALIALNARHVGADEACVCLERAAPSFRWLTAAERWTLVEVSRAVRAELDGH